MNKFVSTIIVVGLFLITSSTAYSLENELREEIIDSDLGYYGGVIGDSITSPDYATTDISNSDMQDYSGVVAYESSPTTTTTTTISPSLAVHYAPRGNDSVYVD
ncbi:MAG: hypothetical protein D3923_02890 [Candidatus Electrothrix sp. AR3]|nr:hypothetical protein [Candidatus Electrothrix sp. AR3]